MRAQRWWRASDTAFDSDEDEVHTGCLRPAEYRSDRARRVLSPLRGRARSVGRPSVVGSLVVLSSALLLSSCSNGAPATVSLPKQTSGCAASRVLATTVHLGTIQNGGATLYAPVCVDGSGPYPFLVDTAASTSFIDSQLASQLHLASAAPATTSTGVGCFPTTDQARVARWSVGGLSLTAQTVLTGDLSGFGSSDAPAGVLGSDVLNRFGAIRINFRARTMDVLAPEGPAPVGAVIVQSNSLQPPPPTLVKGTPSKRVPLTIIVTPGSVLASTSMTFGSQSAKGYPFVVDTGSSGSSIVPQLATDLHLAHAGTVSASGVGCDQVVDKVQSGAWEAGSVSLAPTALGEYHQAGQYATRRGRGAGLRSPLRLRLHGARLPLRAVVLGSGLTVHRTSAEHGTLSCRGLSGGPNGRTRAIQHATAGVK